MIIITSAVDLQSVVNSTLRQAVKELLRRRGQELTADGGALEDRARFIVIERGDSSAAVEAALRFSPLTNLVDGAAFGKPEFVPSFEWVLDHGGFFEAPFVLSDDGFGWVLFVVDEPGVEHRLLALMREHAVSAEAVPS